MMRKNLPLRAKPNGAAAPLRTTPEPPSRKVFNCIVDDTALIAGVKKSTRDGIRKWVGQGSIRLFVPLHTLTLLDHLKKGSEPYNTNAREAIKWLDEITSTPEIESTGRVQLEGTDEQYTTWAEVEQFLLPETLLSMSDSEDDEEDYSEGEDLDNSFAQLDVSDGLSMSSSHSMDDRPQTPDSPHTLFVPRAPKFPTATTSYSTTQSCVVPIDSPNRTARNSAEIPRKSKSPKGTVPPYLQPLFNHILWRVHQEANPDTALESYILLTNDPMKQQIAQRFGIRAKRLEQLRDAVGREDREYKNRMMLYKKENNIPQTVDEKPTLSPPASATGEQNGDVVSDDEDVVLLRRAPRGPQATINGKGQAPNGQRVMDPNDFGRTNPTRGGRGGQGGGQHMPRGGRGGRGGGRGGFVPRGPYVAPASFRAPPPPRVDPTQPIDPDSFARPPPRVNNTRGGRRKLWEPN